MRTVRVAAVLAVLMLGMQAAAARSDEAARCRATLRIEPTEAFVGQPMHWILRIEQRRDVARVRLEPPPTFPAFRSEWLPTVSLPDPDEGQRAYEERRALHPGHAGVLEIPRSGVVCESPDGSTALRIAATRVTVFEPPLEGRPEGWAGTVGPLAVSRTVTPERVALGSSIRVSIRLAGEGNVWTADPGLESALPADLADVFVHPPDLERDAGRTLEVRHYRVYDVVPRREGTLELPALRLPYFDPVSLAYGEATLPAAVVEVGPRETAKASPPVAPAVAPPAGGEATPRRGFGLWAWLLAAAVLAGGVVFVRRRQGGGVEPWHSVAAGSARAEQRLAEGDLDGAAAEITRCLRLLLDAPLPDGGPQADAFRLLVERLERLRFAGDPDPAELRSAAHEALELLQRAREAR